MHPMEQFPLNFSKELLDMFYKKTVFEKSYGKWIDEINAIAKQYNNSKLSSTNLTPIQSFSEKKKGYVYQNYKKKKTEV